MARTRDIRPGFFKNEDLAACNPLARILFQGLWTLADREGRLEDRPQKIKIEVLPYDNCDIEKLFEQLVKFKFIIRYQVEGKNYIWIPTFKQNQRIHPKEPPSVIPEYSRDLPRQNAEIPGNSAPKNAIPSFPTIPTLPSLPPSPKGESEGFKIFWGNYPKKTTKKECSDYWRQEKLDAKLPEILNGLNVWKISDQWSKDGLKFVPDPIRFLKKERWLDAPPPMMPESRGTAIPGNRIVPAEERKGGSGLL